ncbi:hypothetical protein J6590_049931 [Homalodisca vitripennis]|nr:hypothetical protein J6590_049931 [Homalodisca vitripennis]
MGAAANSPIDSKHLARCIDSHKRTSREQHSTRLAKLSASSPLPLPPPSSQFYFGANLPTTMISLNPPPSAVPLSYHKSTSFTHRFLFRSSFSQSGPLKYK